MNKTRREIECLNRLQELTQQRDSILHFLMSENLIDSAKVAFIRQSPDSNKDLHAALRDLKVQQKLQLLEYEWTILPVEIIRLYIITDRAQMEFPYNGG
jgi:hypothetical protein